MSLNRQESAASIFEMPDGCEAALPFSQVDLMSENSQDIPLTEGNLATALARLRQASLFDPKTLRKAANALLALADALVQQDQEVLDSHVRMPVGRRVTEERRLAELAHKIYAMRRRRGRCLQAELLGEPAWDIMLDLYKHTVARRVITVTSACVAAAVPPTTALRWISSLVDEGLVERIPLASDRRTVELRLTGKGFAAMKACLADLETILEL